MIKHPITLAGVVLFLFAVVGVGLVALVHQQTEARIIANERQALLKQLNALVPAHTIDNDIVSDVTTVSAPDRLGNKETQVYLGRKAGKPVAAVFTSMVPDGYSGPIKLLVAVRIDGTLGGVRVISHKETPGLGDRVEEQKSDWILNFENKSLKNPLPAQWKVKKDGGVFDQFTGATVTPRSIIGAVKNTLIYFRDRGESLFQKPGT
jgi:Na+-translocating ferredoxin:NAD+ oxidoreductase subunit G